MTAKIDRIPRQDARTRRAFGGIGADFVPYIGAIKDVDLGAFNFTTTGIVTAANLVLSDKNGIDFTHATDEDIDIIELSGITGDPKIYWDESEDRFRFTKGLYVDVNVAILGTLSVVGLATVGELNVDTLNLSGNVISDSTGTISFDNENLTTLGQLILKASDTRQAEIQQNTLNTGLIYNTNDFHVFKTDGTERVRITDTQLLTTEQLVVQDGGITAIFGADNQTNTSTNNTTKAARMVMPHYQTAEENVALFLASSTVAANSVAFGGGSSTVNAATQIDLYTAANTTTTLGTLRYRIDSSGNHDFQSGNITTTGVIQAEHLYSTDDAVIDDKLTVNGNAQLGDSATDYHGINTAPVSNYGLKLLFSKSTVVSTYGFRLDVDNTTDILDEDIDVVGVSTDIDTSGLIEGDRQYGFKNLFGFRADVASNDEIGADGICELFGIHSHIHFTGTNTAAHRIKLCGGYHYVTGNLGTIGDTAHYGGYYEVLGTSDNNYGLWITVTGATNNYGIVLDRDGAGGGLWFGDGQDASIFYDGTDLWVNTDEVGSGSLKIGDATNYTEIKPDGEINLHGTTRVTRHLRVGAASWDHGASAPTEGHDGPFVYLAFDATTDDEVHYTVIVPSRWDTSTDVEFVVDWYYSGVQDNGTVCWALEYKGVKAGEAIAGGTTIITKTSVGNHTTGQMVRTTFTTKILAANLEENDTLAFRLYRDVSADTLAADARLINTHFHFTQNKLGKAT